MAFKIIVQIFMTIVLASRDNQANLIRSLDIKYNTCCQDHRSRVIRNVTTVVDVREAQRGVLKCCAKYYIGTGKGDFNVTWSFQGQNGSHRSSFTKKQGCFNQVLVTDKVTMNDVGNYSCFIHAQDGTAYKRLTLLKVKKAQYNAVPVIKNVSTPIYAQPGSSVILNCTISFALGSQEPNQMWVKYVNNRQEFVGKRKIKKAVKDTEFLYQVYLTNLTTEDFGTYSCFMTIRSQMDHRNLTVINGVDPKIIEEKEWTAKVISMATFLILFIFVLYTSYRLRYNIAIKLKYISGRQADRYKEMSHDIFIIHSPSASYWVSAVLLDKLESDWKYNCFLPERDVCGGEVYIETVCRELRASKCVVIVVTECLLRSNWCAFMTHTAIHDCLSNSSVVIAITFMSFSKLQEYSEETQNFLKILTLLKKIPCPLNFVPQSFSYQARTSQAFRGTDFVGETKQVKLLKHSKISQDDFENSPKNQTKNIKNQNLIPSSWNSFSSPDIPSYFAVPSFSTLTSLTPPHPQNHFHDNRSNSLSTSSRVPSKAEKLYVPKQNEDKTTCQRTSNMIFGNLKILQSERNSTNLIQEEKKDGYSAFTKDNADVPHSLNDSSDALKWLPQKMNSVSEFYPAKDTAEEQIICPKLHEDSSAYIADMHASKTLKNTEELKYHSEIRATRQSKHEKEEESPWQEARTPLAKSIPLTEKEVDFHYSEKRHRNKLLKYFTENPDKIFWQRLRLHLPNKNRPFSRRVEEHT